MSSLTMASKILHSCVFGDFGHVCLQLEEKFLFYVYIACDMQCRRRSRSRAWHDTIAASTLLFAECNHDSASTLTETADGCIQRVPEKSKPKMFLSYLLQTSADSDKISYAVSSVNLSHSNVNVFHLT